MEMIVLVVGLGLATGALGLLAGRYFWPAPKGADQIALATAQAEVKRLSDEIGALKGHIGELAWIYTEPESANAAPR
jgi:hypothetical protein